MFILVQKVVCKINVPYFIHCKSNLYKHTYNIGPFALTVTMTQTKIPIMSINLSPIYRIYNNKTTK